MRKYWEAAYGPAKVLIGRLLEDYTEERFTFDEKPDEEELERGLPGHWMVVRPTGERYGRAAIPPDEIEKWQGWLGGELHEGVLEYSLGKASTDEWTDPHTGQRVVVSEYAVQYVEEEDSARHTALFSDGTELGWEKTESGWQLRAISPNQAPVQVVCHEDAYVPQAKLTVHIGETSLAVTPQEVTEKGELCPSDPRSTRPVRSAAVVVRHADGTLIRSTGLGSVDVYSKVEVARKGGVEEALRTVEKDGIYCAHCARDVIRTVDHEGNSFDITSQSVECKLAVSISGDDSLNSPRCQVAGVPHLHPDSGFLPLPSAFPPPRLFAVYGDGHGEELLHQETAKRMIAASSRVEVTDLQPPAEGVRAYTLFTKPRRGDTLTSSDLHNPCRGIERPAPPSQELLAVVRHLEEMAPVPAELWEDFTAAAQRFEVWADDHDKAHQAMG